MTPPQLQGSIKVVLKENGGKYHSLLGVHVAFSLYVTVNVYATVTLHAASRATK